MLRRMFIHISAVLLGCLLPVYATGQSLPRGFELVQVTENSADEPFPRINRHSQIVFTHWPANTRRSGQEIFLYDGRTGELTQITDDDVQDVVPDINDAGVICWSRGIGPVDPNSGEPTLEIVMRDPDGTITRLTDNSVPDISPRINNLGVIAWKRNVGVECGLNSDIWMFDGQTVRSVTTDGISNRVSHQSVELNDLNELVWNRIDFCNPEPGFNFGSTIMMYSGGQISELTDEQPVPLLPHINSLSHVVWENFDPDLELRVVEFWENGVTIPLIVNGANPALNDRGDVAFNRWDSSLGQWDMWLLRNDVFHRLTSGAENDLVSSINSSGEAAWSARFNVGRDVRFLHRFADGDLNCDGSIDALDIEPLLWVLFAPEVYDVRLPDCDPMLGDINDDGSVDALDIEPFLNLLFP